MQQTIPVKPDVKGFYESRTGSYVFAIPVERSRWADWRSVPLNR
jgi:hypothetical protein